MYREQIAFINQYLAVHIRLDGYWTLVLQVRYVHDNGLGQSGK